MITASSTELINCLKLALKWTPKKRNVVPFNLLNKILCPEKNSISLTEVFHQAGLKWNGLPESTLTYHSHSLWKASGNCSYWNLSQAGGNCSYWSMRQAGGNCSYWSMRQAGGNCSYWSMRQAGGNYSYWSMRQAGGNCSDWSMQQAGGNCSDWSMPCFHLLLNLLHPCIT